MTNCKFCGQSVELSVSDGSLMLKQGEWYLKAHNTPTGQPCTLGSGITQKDNAQPLISSRLWRGVSA